MKGITKDEFRDINESVQLFPSYTLDVIPSVYKTIEERVLVKEATKKLIYVPAVYETIEVLYVKIESVTKIPQKIKHY